MLIRYVVPPQKRHTMYMNNSFAMFFFSIQLTYNKQWQVSKYNYRDSLKIKSLYCKIKRNCNIIMINVYKIPYCTIQKTKTKA